MLYKDFLDPVSTLEEIDESKITFNPKVSRILEHLKIGKHSIFKKYRLWSQGPPKISDINVFSVK